MKYLPKQRGPLAASIIIPVFNKAELTCQCLRALAEVTQHIPHEVIIVDNASTDDTRERLKVFQGKIVLIANDTNLGFSKACNQGAAKARGNYLVFLNNDTIPLRGWLDGLLQEVESHANVAMVGSKLLYQSGLVQHAGVAFYREHRRAHHPYRLAVPDDPRVNRRRELQAVTAACALIRPEWFVKCGRFNEEYVTSYEDLDLCLNIRRRHGTIVYQPNSVVYHLESQSPGRLKNDDRNAALFFRKWKHWVLADEDAFYLHDDYKLVSANINGRSVPKLARIVGEEERDRWALVARCQVAAAEERTDEVIQLLQRCEEWPKDAAIHRWAGVLCRRMGLLSVAQTHWRAALALDNSPDLRLDLCALAVRPEDVNDLGLNLPGETAAYLRGIAALKNGDYSVAAEALDEALFRGARPLVVLVGQAAVALATGDKEEARRYCQAVLAARPQHPVAMELLRQLENEPDGGSLPARAITRAVTMPVSVNEEPRLALVSGASERTPSPGSRPCRVGILSTEPQDTACFCLRLRSVFSHLQQTGTLEWIPPLGVVHGDKFKLQESSLENADVIVVQRQAVAAVPYAMLRRKLKSSHQKIVFEMDDALTFFPAGHPGAAVYQPIRSQVEEYLRRADLVTVSTLQLQLLYGSFNRNIVVLPNSLDPRFWPPSCASPDPADKVVILFSGTPTHQRDLEIVEPALLDLLAAYPDQVEFLYWGNITKRLRVLPQVKAACDFTADYPEYARLLRKVPVSFAIVPLADTALNRAKSPIKWLEYSICRIPGIYSDLAAYNQTVAHGQTGPPLQVHWLHEWTRCFFR